MGAIGFKAVKNGLSLLLSGDRNAFWCGFGIVGLVAGFLIHGMVDYPFSTPKLVFTFFTVLALAEQCYCLNRDRLTEKRRTLRKPRIPLPLH